MHPALAYLQPFGVDLFCTGKKFLVLNLVGRNLKIKYRRSYVGVFWTLLSPLCLAAVYYFVFKVILKVAMPHYLAYVLSGVLPWTFFAQSVIESLESITGHVGLITKVPVPVQVFPYVCNLTNLVTFGLAVPVLLGVSLVTGVLLGPSLIVLPLLLACLFLLAYSLSLILAILHVYLRDLKHLVGIGMQLWFYGTPVLYDVQMIPEKYRWIIYANPLGNCFHSIHEILARGAWPDPIGLAVTAGWTLLAVFGSSWVYLKMNRGLVENL